MLPASQRAYNISEVRQNILRYLEIADLARFIRVEKNCITPVARELYRTMCYLRVLHMPDVTSRQKTYLSSVKVIDCRSASLMPPWLRNTLPKENHTWHHLEPYSPENFSLVVSPIRAKCPLLRKMTFGTDQPRWRYHESGENDSFVVTFSPSSKGSKEGKAHLDYYHTFMCVMETPPPKALKTPILPSEQYTIHVRLNLFLEARYTVANGRNIGGPVLTDEWLDAIRTNPLFDHLHTHIDFHFVTPTLGDVRDLYLRQIARGYSDRLQWINAPFVQTWSLPDFRSFASVAAESLTTLRLHDWNDNGWPDEASNISLAFKDLPAFIAIVRGSLVNLQELIIGVRGIRTAEADCGEMLDKDTLADGGTITDIRIVPDGESSTELFNVLRVFSQLCTPTARVDIQLTDVEGSAYDAETQEDQTEFLRYLRRQPQSRRIHLATVNFPMALGITRLVSARCLVYDMDGRPLPSEQHNSAGSEASEERIDDEGIDDTAETESTGGSVDEEGLDGDDKSESEAGENGPEQEG